MLIDDRSFGIEVGIATADDIAKLDEHMPVDGLDDAHGRRLLLQQEDKGLYLIAFQGQRPVGYVFLHFRHPAYHASFEYYSECAYLEALTVHRERRRQGVATALMRASEEAARSHAQSLGLSVGVDNAPARALNRKMGYRITGIPPYSVTWSYLEKGTGEWKQEGEVCNFWSKPLVLNTRSSDASV